jgi:hypothetical protein
MEEEAGGARKRSRPPRACNVRLRNSYEAGKLEYAGQAIGHELGIGVSRNALSYDDIFNLMVLISAFSLLFAV